MATKKAATHERKTTAVLGLHAREPKAGDVWKTQDGREWVLSGARGFRGDTMELTTWLANHQERFGICGRAFSPEEFTNGTLMFVRGAGPAFVDKEVPSGAASAPPADLDDVEKLIDFCRRNLAAPAWLPLAVQRQLFAAFEKERAERSVLVYRLTAATHELRYSLREERAAHQHTKNLFASMSRRVANAEKRIAALDRTKSEKVKWVTITKTDRERLKALGRKSK